MKKQQYIMYGLLLAAQSVQTQDFGFDDDVQDVPAAPIDDWVIPVMVTVLCWVLYKTYLKNKWTHKI